MYCICCKKDKVKPYEPTGLTQNRHDNEENLLWKDEVRNGRRSTIDNEMVANGIIQIITAGFGSIHDGDQFIIAICDECIKDNEEDGTLLLFKSGDYLDGDKHIEKNKKICRRRRNLDNLID